MVARPAMAGAGLFKLVAPDDGLTQWSTRRMVGEMANDERRAGPASACRPKTGWRDIAAAWTDYLHHCKEQGLHFIQPGRFVLPGDMAGAPALQFFPWPDVDTWGESKLAQADKHTNAGMLRERFNYYCEKVVKGFYKNHFLRFDRQIVLVDWPATSQQWAHRHLMICVWH
ncbi:putative ATP-binding protein [Escherichia coli]|uniref:Putative ATP-binding protein n=1 Tax=Escherichia coli TaxID=562 RepID=A0A2X1IYM9_ECOLX|nr:putative ATP-binding protein [Escherichia coli]